MNDLKRVLNKNLGACLALCVALAPMPQVQAGPKTKEASERFQRGVELYRAGDVRAANIEFKRAYSIEPNYRLLFNIAQASAELKDYVTAHRYFERYLQEGKGKISTERADLVRAEIARMKSYLGTIELQIEAEDAVVTVDGVEISSQELQDEKILVGAGRRTIGVSAPGYQKFETVVDVAGEDELSLPVKLEKLPTAQVSVPAASPVPAVEPVRKAPVAKSGMGPLFWTGLGATAALGAGTVVLGVMTQQAQQTNRDVVAKVPTTQAQIDQSAKRLRTLATATDVGIALTGAAAVFTVASAILRVKRNKKAQEPKLRAGLHPRGVLINGRF